jgi:hypothetical protein
LFIEGSVIKISVGKLSFDFALLNGVVGLLGLAVGVAGLFPGFEGDVVYGANASGGFVGSFLSGLLLILQLILSSWRWGYSKGGMGPMSWCSKALSK